MNFRFLQQVLLACAFVVGFSINASAAGLGKATVHSKLGDTLHITIPVYGLQDLAPEQTRITLADQESHERLNMQWNYQLSQAKMQLSPIINGKATLTIKGNNLIIHEPFIEFALLLRWPQGDIVKGYTLLIEPPLQ